MGLLVARNWRIWSLSITLLTVSLFTSHVCKAEIGDIAEDLREIEGYVVKELENEFIIDHGTTAGISVGDVYNVVGPGEELVHPVTNEVIGTLEKSKGVLRVIRLADEYAFARAVGHGADIRRGDRIQRFAGLKAMFLDYTGSHKGLFADIRNSLPALQWQDYRHKEKNRLPQPESLDSRTLLFVAQSDVLVMYDAELSPVRRYALDTKTETGRYTPASPSQVKKKVTGAIVKKTEVQSEPVEPETSPAVAIEYGSSGSDGQLHEDVLMADLLLDNGDRLVATTDGERIRIVKMNDAFRLITEAETEPYEDIFALKWWSPRNGSAHYLVVLAWSDERIDSSIYALSGDGLVRKESGLDSILGTFDLDDDGRRESLFSQEFDDENFFGRRINQLYWAEGELAEKDPEVILPPKFNVISGQIADLTGDGALESAYIHNGVLWIYAGKERIYASPQQMGGSLSVLTYKVDPDVIDYRTTSAFFEVAPVAVDVDGDGRKELLAVSSDRSSFRIPGVAPSIGSSRIMIFDYTNGGFVKGTFGPKIEAAIQGMDIADGRLFFVTTETGQSAEGTGTSRLQSFTL